MHSRTGLKNPDLQGKGVPAYRTPFPPTISDPTKSRSRRVLVHDRPEPAGITVSFAAVSPPASQTPAEGHPAVPGAAPRFPRSWSCGWSKSGCMPRKGNHNSKIGGRRDGGRRGGGRDGGGSATAACRAEDGPGDLAARGRRGTPQGASHRRGAERLLEEGLVFRPAPVGSG